jgi:hypothetical protein
MMSPRSRWIRLQVVQPKGSSVVLRKGTVYYSALLDTLKPRTLASVLLFGVLAQAGCSSGITQTDEVCASSRVKVASFADCLRRNYAMLSSGSPGQSDLGALYLAAAEFQAAQVAEGRKTDAMAMFELADWRTRVLTPIENQRRDQELQNVMKAIQSAANSGGQSGNSASAQGRSRYK